MLALRAGVRPEVVLPRVQQLAAAAAGQPDVLVITPFVPTQLAQIRDVRALPVALGYLLIVLAVGGVGLTLGAAVRTRTAEIGVLRALGMTSRQSRSVIRTQAVVFGTIALLVGIPLGLALGRTLWRVTADIMPLQYRAPFPSTALVLVGPLVFSTVILLAARPARRAARLRIADALRTE
jgi:ABC-type antimicrobial peptide transport system permease subunit